ncbi:MAG: hypothetical protein ACXWMX_04920 [Candidatus Limnocylindrales bacterium]
MDPDDTGRFIQIRGDAELLTEGAVEHTLGASPSTPSTPDSGGRAD